MPEHAGRCWEVERRKHGRNPSFGGTARLKRECGDLLDTSCRRLYPCRYIRHERRGNSQACRIELESDPLGGGTASVLQDGDYKLPPHGLARFSGDSFLQLWPPETQEVIRGLLDDARIAGHLERDRLTARAAFSVDLAEHDQRDVVALGVVLEFPCHP